MFVNIQLIVFYSILKPEYCPGLNTPAIYKYSDCNFIQIFWLQFDFNKQFIIMGGV